MKTTRIELTYKFIAIALVAAVTFLVFWELRRTAVSIAVMLFIAFIFNAGLRPLVGSMQYWRVGKPLELGLLGTLNGVTWVAGKAGYDLKAKRLRLQLVKLGRWRLGRTLSVLLLYSILIAFVLFVILLLANQFITQALNLINALPEIFKRLIEFLQTSVPIVGQLIPLELLQTELSTFVDTIINSSLVGDLLTGANFLAILTETVGVFSSVAEILISLITVVILSIYMLMRKEPIYEGLMDLLPDRNAKSFRRVLAKIESSLGSWMVGEFTLMLTIGVVTYLILWIPGLFDPTYTLDDYALPIALIAGILEALPNVGPSVTLILSGILALGTSGTGTFFYVLVAFTLLQQLEGVFLVPTVMRRAVGIDPILSILGIISGFSIGGPVGAILAIPLIGIIQIVILEISQEYKRLERQRPKLVE